MVPFDVVASCFNVISNCRGVIMFQKGLEMFRFPVVNPNELVATVPKKMLLFYYLI